MATHVVEIPSPQESQHHISEKKLGHGITKEDEKKPRLNRLLRVADEYWLLEWFGLFLAFGSVAGLAALLGSLHLLVSY